MYYTALEDERVEERTLASADNWPRPDKTQNDETPDLTLSLSDNAAIIREVDHRKTPDHYELIDYQDAIRYVEWQKGVALGAKKHAEREAREGRGRNGTRRIAASEEAAEIADSIQVYDNILEGDQFRREYKYKLGPVSQQRDELVKALNANQMDLAFQWGRILGAQHESEVVEQAYESHYNTIRNATVNGRNAIVKFASGDAAVSSQIVDRQRELQSMGRQDIAQALYNESTFITELVHMHPETAQPDWDWDSHRLGHALFLKMREGDGIAYQTQKPVETIKSREFGVSDKTVEHQLELIIRTAEHEAGRIQEITALCQNISVVAGLETWRINEYSAIRDYDRIIGPMDKNNAEMLLSDRVNAMKSVIDAREAADTMLDTMQPSDYDHEIENAKTMLDLSPDHTGLQDEYRKLVQKREIDYLLYADSGRPPEDTTSENEQLDVEAYALDLDAQEANLKQLQRDTFKNRVRRAIGAITNNPTASQQEIANQLEFIQKKRDALATRELVKQARLALYQVTQMPIPK